VYVAIAKKNVPNCCPSWYKKLGKEKQAAIDYSIVVACDCSE